MWTLAAKSRIADVASPCTGLDVGRGVAVLVTSSGMTVVFNP